MFIRKIFDFAPVYTAFQNMIVKKNERADFFKRYIGDTTGKRILDLGCGTANILEHIHDEKEYIGIDFSEKYIEDAKKRFANRKTSKFYTIDLNEYSKTATEKFDIVLMIGVLHHISDDEAEQALCSIKRLMADGGVFISHDPCYTKKMNPIARLMCMFDRGKYVRYADDYITLQKKYWTDIKYDIRTDTLKIPYSVIIFRNIK